MSGNNMKLLQSCISAYCSSGYGDEDDDDEEEEHEVLMIVTIRHNESTLMSVGAHRYLYHTENNNS